MDLRFTADECAFRQEVRAFFRTALPADIRRKTELGQRISKEEMLRWVRILHDRGWATPSWAPEWGGTGWDPVRQYIFKEELHLAPAPEPISFNMNMIGPTLIAFGSEAQKRRYLAPMLSGEEFWAQGFSEPNAGSDLANLKTQAVLDGDEWIVNGQKIWTSDAMMSEWGFFLVRTDSTVKPQRGISFLLIRMDTPGLTVRPIVSIEGGTGLNEVFLENVRVPAENLVGEAGMGWTYAKYLLEKERTTSAFLYFNKRELARARSIASAERVGGKGLGLLIDTPAFAQKLARAEVEVQALEYSVLRILSGENNRQSGDAVVSALKLRGSALQQRVTELQLEALGLQALRQWGHGEGEVLEGEEALRWPAYVPGRTAQALIARASTIYGGSQEIQKNIIAKLAFGL